MARHSGSLELEFRAFATWNVECRVLLLTFALRPDPARMASAPFPVEIPTDLLNHTLSQLDEAESDRLYAARNGTVKNDSAYPGCSYTLKTSTEGANRRDNRWANVYSCKCTTKGMLPLNIYWLLMLFSRRPLASARSLSQCIADTSVPLWG